MMYCYKICAAREGSFDLEFREGGYYGGEDVSPAKHLLADGHEVGDCVVAIADELEIVSVLTGLVGGVRYGRTSWRLFAISACTR